MKKVVEQYAMSIVAAMIALLLFMVCYQMPLWDEVVADILWQPQLEANMGKAFDESMDRKAPTIVLKDVYALKAGQQIEIATIFDGYSWEGTSIPVTIEKIYSEDLSDVLRDLSTESGSICMENAGIYWALTETTDFKGDRLQVLAKVFVNER